MIKKEESISMNNWKKYIGKSKELGLKRYNFFTDKKTASCIDKMREKNKEPIRSVIERVVSFYKENN